MHNFIKRKKFLAWTDIDMWDLTNLIGAIFPEVSKDDLIDDQAKTIRHSPFSLRNYSSYGQLRNSNY